MAAVALVMVGGVAAWLVLRSPGSDESKLDASEQRQVKSVLHLENFVVNLADTEENRFLRVGIDLGLETDNAGSEKVHGDNISTALIRDTILTVLATWRSDALLAPEGKAKLKEELVRALRARVPELRVREVFFTDFLVQR